MEDCEMCSNDIRSTGNAGVTPDFGAVFPLGDDSEVPSLGTPCITKSLSTNNLHRSRSMDVATPCKEIKVYSHRSRSMDFVSNGQTHKRQSMSKMVCLDSERGIVLNLHLEREWEELTSPSLLPKLTNVPKHTFEIRPDGSLDVGDRKPIRSASDHSNNWPQLTNDPYVHLTRKISTTSCASALTFHDEECPTQLESFENYQTRSKSSLVMWPEEKSYPNDPHPALEYPPLYFLIRRFPFLLELTRGFFSFRWRISYPLQHRIPFSRIFFRKMNVFITVGELLLLLPFMATLILCPLYSFVYPSVDISGHAARIPLIFAFVTAMRNSLLTLLLGIPHERAMWYHKFSAKLAYLNGIMHTLVAFFHPEMVGPDDLPPPSTSVGSTPNFWQFLFSDKINSGGTMLMVFMTLMVISALPFVRRRVFEVFYYLHISFATSMIVCAFFHTGMLVPILAALTWGVDLTIRKIYMACFRYERKASVRMVSETVVELCFPKTKGFDYNPGQYIYLAIPAISIFEWHPFSLSSSPGQKIVTLHIRRVGDWTSALHDLAKKQMEVSILIEGPYGSMGVDLTSDRYKMIMLFSGGIGVTPMQSLCNQLMYEQSTGLRELKKLSFIWIERDPNVMSKVDVVRRKTCSLDASPDLDIESGRMNDTSRQPQGIASTLLSFIPVSRETDEQLEDDYSSSDFDEIDYFDELCTPSADDGSVMTLLSKLIDRRNACETGHTSTDSSILGDDTMNQSYLDAAYNASNDLFHPEQPLDLQVYLTTKGAILGRTANLPFVHHNRPDVKEIFLKMREDALARGEKRVAVCVCAPARLVVICQKACAKYSDSKVRFDLHVEVFG